jgi:hypothetical protein
MLDFVQFSGLVFKQTIGNTVGTNCTRVFTDLFLHAYEAYREYREKNIIPYLKFNLPLYR